MRNTKGCERSWKKMWKVTVTVVLVVIGALGAVTLKLGEWLQEISGSQE